MDKIDVALNMAQALQDAINDKDSRKRAATRRGEFIKTAPSTLVPCLRWQGFFEATSSPWTSFP
jgi:hypothetical protein